MAGQQTPLSLGAALANRTQHDAPAAWIHVVRRLVHLFPLYRKTLRICFDYPTPG
jgi:hypothetical protein